MRYTGARILVESLVEQGVDTVFGYPGGAVLYIYDELFKHRDRIRHILTSHEQGASHAADGYARATGRVGVCIATSGPGATNLVTGIATAYMDSVPMVAITGNVPTTLLGRDSFQEVDIAGITMPVVKHNWIVKDVDELAETMREAFIVARSGRPGPVLVDVPKDVTAALAEWVPCAPGTVPGVPPDGAAAARSFAEADGPVGRPGRTESDGHARAVAVSTACADSSAAARAARLLARESRPRFVDADLAAALELIAASERPYIYAGGGVIISEASAELRTLAERLRAPVALSLMAHGCLPYDHPLLMGMIGMHGTRASNAAVQKADLIIAVGARFSDRVVSKADSFARNAKILHIDIDPAEINKTVHSERWIIGDLKLVLGRLLERIEPRSDTTWNDEIRALQAIVPAAHSARKALHPKLMMEAIAARVGPEAIVATDVGQHQMWVSQFYPFVSPRSFLTSGGLGTMGYGLGGAIGAKAAFPDRPVVLVTGDGSFRMNCVELATATNYGLALLIVVVNNGTLGMVRQWQTLFYDERYAETTLERPPDFVKLAEAYGIPGFLAVDGASLTTALDTAMELVKGGRAALVEARVDIDEQVLPMVPGGKAIDEQIL